MFEQADIDWGFKQPPTPQPLGDVNRQRRGTRLSGAAHVQAFIVARASDAPSRARRFALALTARPLTARAPARWNGHIHEAHAALESAFERRTTHGNHL
jgi:hypothetical protein